MYANLQILKMRNTKLQSDEPINFVQIILDF